MLPGISAHGGDKIALRAKYRPSEVIKKAAIIAAFYVVFDILAQLAAGRPGILAPGIRKARRAAGLSLLVFFC